MYDSQMHVTISFYAEKEMELLVLINKVREKLIESVLTIFARESPDDTTIRVGEHSKAALCVEWYDDGESIYQDEKRE